MKYINYKFLDITAPRITNLVMDQQKGTKIANERIRKVKYNPKVNKTIDLSGLLLNEVPDGLFTVPNLVEVDLSNNQISELPAKISEAKSLNRLVVSNNNLLTFPEEIKNLSKLATLYAEGNLLKILPSGFSGLKNLRRLNLNKNKFDVFPRAILELNLLESLGLKENHIRSVPTKIVHLRNLKILFLNENPIENIPIEIVGHGRKGIFNYIQQLELGEVDYLYEAKIVLVGRGFVGKTSLMHKLTNPSFKLSEKIETTEGIEIYEWDLHMDQDGKQTFRFNVWDFAGQEKYDATHQFFLTERSLYLFVTEARQESNFLDFDYWLNIIKLRSNNSPIIVVQNKIDERDKELPIKKYKNAYPEIVEFVKISCANGYEYTIKSLTQIIKNSVKNLPQAGDILPKAWVEIRNELEQIDIDGKDYISFSDYLEICKKYDLSREQASLLSRYYHDLGVIIHHQDELNLSEIVIINPDWAIDGVYDVLDAEVVIENKGKFTEKDLERIWSEPQYIRKRAELLGLMKKYELCFELYDSTFITPHLLPADPPSNLPEFNSNVLLFHYDYEFMPAGLLTRLIVKINEQIKGEFFWRYGVILEHEKGSSTLAQVVEDIIEKRISIKIIGPYKRELLYLIRKELSNIHLGFNNLEFDELIPCNCNVCKESSSPHFFKYGVLRNYELENVQNIRCDISVREISVKVLIESSILSPNTENLPIMENEVSNIGDLIEENDSSFLRKQKKRRLNSFWGFKKKRGRSEIIIEYIRENKLDKALNELKLAFSNDPTYSKEIIIQQSLLNKIDRDERLGQLSPENAEIDRTKIKRNVLAYMEFIQR